MGKPNYSVEVGSPANENETAPRRNYKAAKAPWTHPPGKPHIKTIYDLFEDAVKEFGPRRYMGTRKLLKTHNEEKEITKVVNGEETTVTKTWQYFEMGPYEWNTYESAFDTATLISSGLVKLGVKPGRERFHLYLASCADWLLTFLALSRQNITAVTAYDTLGDSGLQSSIEETSTVGILADRGHFATLLKVLPSTPSIRIVVWRDTEGPLVGKDLEDCKKLEEIRQDIKVLPLSELIKIGKENPAEPTRPKDHDKCCIMYTSGSVGKPKGVILLHSTIVAGVSGAIGNISAANSSDVFLNILPLAHIFELTAELVSLYFGCSLGYGTPKTVSDVNMRNCKGDIRELRPTLLAAVPAVYEAIKKGVFANVRKLSPTMQSVFWRAYRLKIKMDAWGLPTPIMNAVVFRKIKEATGGRLRFIMSGGAAISADTRLFLNTLVAPLSVGYGLTETNAMACLMDLNHIDLDTSGELTPVVTCKLVSFEEAGYYAKNLQGEVYLRGPCISPGYYNNEEETKEAFTADGWFRTGDIAEWTDRGCLRLIDRRKNLVKTANGEYLALERLESLYRSDEYILNLCLFADDQHVHPVAVVVPNPVTIKELCEKKKLEYDEDIVRNPKIYKEVLKSLQQTGRANGLKGFELIAGISFDEEWTPQNGFVSSAQKVQRRKIKEHNKEGIEKAFKDA